MLTLQVQSFIEAKDEDDYEQKRNALVCELEKMGLSVDIQSEDDDTDSDFGDC